MTSFDYNQWRSQGGGADGNLEGEKKGKQSCVYACEAAAFQPFRK